MNATQTAAVMFVFLFVGTLAVKLAADITGLTGPIAEFWLFVFDALRG